MLNIWKKANAVKETENIKGTEIGGILTYLRKRKEITDDTK